MQNIYKAITNAGLQNQIKVSTAVDTNLLGVFDCPSIVAFSDNVRPFIEPIIGFLVSSGGEGQLELSTTTMYSILELSTTTNQYPTPYSEFMVQDGQLEYKNLFDTLMDAMYSILEKTIGGSLEIIVLESGWPSTGSVVETIENASTYYRNLINRVKVGTPKRPAKAIETYLFALFDENLKTRN